MLSDEIISSLFPVSKPNVIVVQKTQHARFQNPLPGNIRTVTTSALPGAIDKVRWGQSPVLHFKKSIAIQMLPKKCLYKTWEEKKSLMVIPVDKSQKEGIRFNGVWYL